MKFVDRIKFAVTGKAKHLRDFGGHSGAQDSRITADWMAADASIDKFIERDLKKLRARSVDLERDDGYVRRFLSEVESNVVGPNGITFKPQCRKRDNRTPNGIASAIDESACEALAQAWQDFGKRENFSTQRRFTRRRFEQLAVRAVARDGGFLTRWVPGFGNDFGFAVQPIRATSLDPNFSDPKRGVYMSVEFNDWDEPTAYWIKTRKAKGENMPGMIANRNRVGADEMRHLFVADDFDQTQGKPWMTAAMIRLRMLGAYEEAEVIAAREQAQKTEYFKQNDDSEWIGSKDAQGNFLQPSEPLEKFILPRGIEPELISPEHPNANYPEFRKAMLRGIAAPLIVSYNVLANDLEGVSFSSIRQGVLSERELWKCVQVWFIDDFEIPLFQEWLPRAILSGQLPPSIQMRDIDRLGIAEFSGRRWSWVDPLKDVAAAAREIQLSVNSRSRVAAERDRDFRKLVEENSTEQSQMQDAELDTGLK